MRKIVAAFLLCGLALTANAVPAKRGWQTRTQADGTTIEVQLIGDEFYHYMINREGKQVREVNGMYVVVGEAPTPAVARARHAAAKARRQRKDVGTTPNLAPKGIVVLVNFSDKSMQSGHTNATFDELCNSTNCTVNDGYPSAAQYFADQSNGSYRPQFDVYGPVTLSHTVDYYGHNIDLDSGELTDESDPNTTEDRYATDAVIEACILANQQYSINWADYDSDNDGYVDFVYVIYSGKGEADGGASNTIWPHNYSIQEVVKYYDQDHTYTIYQKSQTKLGGKYLDNYAMSSELSGNALGGIGTLCHEFGHVIGLPDLYDTDYGTNYDDCLTPNDWNIMDGGSYNADGHCPPNYDPWQKDFFGWHTPINLGSEGQNVTLYANGTTNYQAYQLTANGNYISPTTSGIRYYIENRQAVGWDAPLTGHGMLIWKVDFNATAWENNSPNNTKTSGSPLHTVVSATETRIGWDGDNDNCPKNTFPGSGNKTSWTSLSGKPLLNIAESNQIITLTYIEEPTVPVDPFEITWMSNDAEFDVTASTGKIVLPESEPDGCDGKVFVGWTSTADYEDATTAPTFVKAGQAAAEGDVFYAVFATQEGEGGGSFDGNTGGTFKICADVGGTRYYATTLSSNNKLQSTTNEADAVEFTFEKVSNGFTIKLGDKYINYVSGTNINAVDQSYTWTIEEGTKGTWRINAATSGRALVFRAGTYNVFGGYATTNITASGTEYYDLEISGGGASYSNYTTSCSGVTPEPVYYTIRFFDNGAQVGEAQSVLKNAQAEVPTVTPACADYTFVGWWTAELEAENTEAKTWVTNFKATKDQDYYAIYSKTVEAEGGEGNSGSGANVTFSTAASDNNQESTAISNLVETAEGIASYTGSKVYAGVYGVKLGSSKSAGSLTMVLSSAVTTNTIKVDAKKYNNDAGTLSITVNEEEAFGTAQSPEVNGGVLTFTADNALEISSVTISSSKRAYVKSVEIVAGGGPSSTTYYTSTQTCGATAVTTVNGERATVRKEIRNGQLVIIRGNAVYSVTGKRLQ